MKSHQKLNFGHIFILLWLLFCIWLIWLKPSPSDGPSLEQQTLVDKAFKKIPECKALGDKAIFRTGKVLAWNLDDGSFHRVKNLLDGAVWHSKGSGPITVFLVTTANREELGTYSQSRKAAYREWVDVFVIAFPNVTDSGTAVGVYQLKSDPPKSRLVSYRPEYGGSAEPIAKWINALPAK
ncbi:MAG: hypothetical protein WCS99_09445 [Limisphaerales bacterium]